MNSKITLCSISFFVLLLSSCLADIRTTKVIKEGLTEDHIQKGRLLLKEMGEAHGIEQYNQFTNARITLRDEWQAWLSRTFIMPWSENKTLLQLDYLVGKEDSRLTFLEGKRKGEVWGIQHWATYKEKNKAAAIFKQQKDIKFWLPTIQYFIEMPFAVQSGGMVSYAGEATFSGKICDLVYITWQSAEPNKNMDQYILWINRKTKILEMAEFTVRDQARFLKGKINYEEYKTVNGVQISFKQTVGSEEEGTKFMHRFKLESFDFDVTVPDGLFYPKPNLKKNK